MAVYNLAEKYETKLDERFTEGSYTDRWTSNDYSFDGVNSIKVWTLGQATINDYTLTPETGVSRFGAIREVSDELNTYVLTKKKSFNESFDETNVKDQMFVKKANAFLKQVWDEQFVPMIDQDRFTAWANGAGNNTINATALTKSSIITAMLTAHSTLNNKRVPRKNRALFIRETDSIKFKLSDELANNESWTTKSIVNGQVGNLSGYPVIAVPDDLLPAGMTFMIKYKNASIDPVKMKMLRVITNSENVAGSLMQGLVRFDSFVLANKADGIFGYYTDGVAATPTIAKSSTNLTITSTTDSATIKYTIDGSNPKTSATAQVYSAAFAAPAAGTVVRAYAAKSGMVDSGITSYTVI